MIQYDQHHSHIQISTTRTRDEAIALSPLASELAYAHRMGVADAKAHFSHVVSAAEERGESTVIVRYGKPVALVTPLPQKAPGIAQAKGKTTKENLDRNFSMPSPDGYRKALRLMKQAEKFGRPVICFVDTPGAFCGLEAEERGQGEAIARNLFELSGLKVPVLSVVIGEGGSGGALAMAVADEVWMLENAVYSVLSPEGFASILWKDSKRASEAAEVMKLTAGDLKRLGIIEQVISEPEDFDAENMEAVCEELEGRISSFLADYTAYSSEELTARRYDRFRKM